MSFASICVLSYNRPRFLRTAVESLTTNAGAPIEVIVHDDGSTDPEVRPLIFDLMQQGLVSSAVLNQPGWNQGRGVAMNRGMAIGRGDPLMIADQDLVFHPDWLLRVHDILALAPPDATPRIGVLSGFNYWYDPCDWRKTLRADHGAWQEHDYIMGSFMAIPRAAWEALGPFEESSEAFAEDHVFQRKVAASPPWVCASPATDLMFNQGYGVGPSTVVVANPDGGKPLVQRIHMTPHIINRED